MKLIIPVIDKHALLKKVPVKTVSAPWIDKEQKICMADRDRINWAAQKPHDFSEWQLYCKIRNEVTKKAEGTPQHHP